MKKTLLIIILLTLTACTSTQKTYLENKYYNEGNFIEIKNIDNLENETYILYTYNNYCTFEKPCEDVFKEYMEKYKIDILKIQFDNFKKTSLYKQVKYGPSIIIVKNNKILAYLDANKKQDKQKYQDITEFENWINKYIYTKVD